VRNEPPAPRRRAHHSTSRHTSAASDAIRVQTAAEQKDSLSRELGHCTTTPSRVEEEVAAVLEPTGCHIVVVEEHSLWHVWRQATLSEVANETHHTVNSNMRPQRRCSLRARSSFQCV